ncbi:MAG TPA: hypothetical protein VGO16_02785 [Pseudonocardiaceae bacterium]|jgi:hypothetical protein|nr:hypothetical protein [Pseudonocardiaceae bacterium]
MNQTPRPYDPTALLVVASMSAVSPAAQGFDGSAITLTTLDGRKVTVTAASTVDVNLRSEGSVADLKPRQTVVVSGQTGSDGSITADRIDVGGRGPR